MQSYRTYNISNLKKVRRQRNKLAQFSDYNTKILKDRIFENSMIPIVVMDAISFKYIDCNNAAVTKYGYTTKQEVLGKTPDDFSAKIQYDGIPSSQKAKEYIQKAIDTGSIVFEWLHKKPDGTVWDAEVQLLSFTDHGKKYLQFSLFDITERKKKESNLSQLQSLLNTLVNSTKDLIWAVDPVDFKIIFYNNAIQEFLLSDYNTNITIGSKIEDLIPYELSLIWKDFFRKTLESGAFETFFDTRKSNTNLNVSFNPLIVNNEVIGVSVFAKDITQIRQTEKALRESEERYRYIFENAPIAIYQRELDGEYIFGNKTLAKQLECSNYEEFLENYGTIPQRWNDISLLEKYEYELITNESVQNFEMPIKLINGKTKWLSINAHFDKSRNTINGFTLDITEQKIADKKIRKYEEELHEKMCRLENQNKELQEKNTEIEKLNEEYLIANSKIEESELRFKAIYENAMDGISLANPDGQLISVNKAYYNMFGYSESEMLKMTIFDLAVQQPIENSIFEKTLHQGQGKKNRVLLKRKDNSLIYVDISGKLLEFEHEKLVLGILKDVTENVKAEIAIQESQKRLEKLLNTVSDYMYTVEFDKNEVVKSIHGEGCKTITGYSPSEFSNNKFLWFNIIHIDDRNYVNSQIQEFIRDKKTRIIEHRLIKKDGSVCWVRNIPVMRFDENNNLVGYDGMIKDITERKYAETALRESEELYRHVTSHSGFLVFEINPENLLMTWNGDVEKITGYNLNEFNNIRTVEWLQFVHPEDRIQFESCCRDIQTKEISSEYEFRLLVKSGYYIWINMSAFTLNRQKISKRIVGVLKDITIRKSIEQKILKNVIDTEERERIHFSQELHDGLGPLLSAIKMYVQWLSVPNTYISTSEIIKDTEKIIDEAANAVRDISFKLSPHILQNYGIKEALIAYIEKIKKSTEIEINIETENLFRFDELKETIIYRVIGECLNNTLKHAKASRIDISLKRENNNLIVHYKDNGSGFIINHEDFHNKGIGLFNMKSRIKSLNGNMQIFSNPGEGMEIIINVQI